MRIGSQLVGIVFLSRILEVGDFGVMAMAMSAVAFATLLRDLGISSALIQKPEVTEDDLATAVFTQTATAALLGIMFALFAPWTAVILGEERIIPILRWLAIVFPLNAMSSVSQAMMERAGRFRTVALVEITSTLVGLVAAVFFATHRFGVLTLVFQSLAASVISTCGLLLLGPALRKGHFEQNRLRALLGFGGHLTLFNLLNFFSRNADNILIGRNMGSVDLGIYSQAYKVMLFPVQNLTLVAGRALYPALCRDQGSLDQVWGKFLKATRMISTLSSPLLLFIVIFRAEFVLLVFGRRWASVAPLLICLGLTGCVQTLVSLTGTVFMAMGKTKLLFRVGAFSTFTQVTAFVIGSHMGLASLVQLYFVANLINAIVILSCVLSLLHGNWHHYLVSALPTYLAAAATLGCSWFMVTFWGHQNHLTALFFGLGGLIWYLLIIYWLMPKRVQDFEPIWKIATRKGRS